MKKLFISLAFVFTPAICMAQTPIKVEFDDVKPKEKTNLEKLLNADVLGKNYRKLKILPKAYKIEGRNRYYLINDCQVKLWVFRNEGRINPQYDGIIEAIEVEISNKCTFDFAKIFPSLAPQKTANQIIIKDIIRDDTEFYSKCFLECGEAKFQPVEFRYGLKQADGYLVIDFVIEPSGNEKTALIANKLANDFQTQGAKISDDINCDIKRNKLAINAFENEKITSIRFGMEDMDRESLPSCKVGE